MALYPGSAKALATTTNPVNVSSAAVPSSGQVLTATGATTATWQTPSGGASANNVYFTARLATATALPANTYLLGVLTAVSLGALTVDGVAVANGDIILVKNEATGANNGLYTVTSAGSVGLAYVLTRSTQMDSTGEFVGTVIPVASEGTANKNTEWRCTNATAPTVGTTAITFEVQYLGAATATSINKITLTAPATSATLTVADGKTLTASNSITLAGTDGKGINVGAATSGKFLIGDGTNMVLSTSTIPTSAGATAGKMLVSDGTNYVLTTPTFPNASATSGKIIKSDGTNWIASTETYAAPGTSGNVLTSDGTNWTSAALSLPVDQLQIATISLSSNDILNLETSAKELIAAPGAGKLIVVDQLVYSFTAGGVAYTGGGGDTVSYNGGTSPAIVAQLGAALTTSATSTITFRPGIAHDMTGHANQNVTMFNTGSTYATGNGTAKIFIRYRIITL